MGGFWKLTDRLEDKLMNKQIDICDCIVSFTTEQAEKLKSRKMKDEQRMMKGE